MRIVNGYVCMARTKDEPVQTLLFGKNVNNAGERYENMQTNGVRAYDMVGEAVEAEYLLSQRRDFERVEARNIRMIIAERPEEFGVLGKEPSLIVIRLERRGEPWNSGVVGWYFLGPSVKGKPDIHPIPGALLSMTGFRTFDSLDKALELGKEVNRQGDSAFWLASFSLKGLKGKHNNS